ncbi:reverse transcriptase zinc-binding domain-containing protein [Tanacetum coccineum]
MGKKGNATTRKMSKLISNPYTSLVESIALTFFITNFPPKWDSKKLWEWCMVHGKVVDVYIARKMSKVGKWVGFNRFMGVGDDEEFLKKLSFEWIGSYHVYVSVDRFKRSKANRMGRLGMANHTSIGNNHGIKSQTFYANVVVRKEQTESLPRSNNIKDMNLKSIHLKDNCLIKLDDSVEVVLAKVREVETKEKLYSIIECQGFTDVDIHHVGGLWVWVAFKNQSASMRDFVVDERMVWIEIEGLPLCARGSEALKKNGGVWGTFMFFDDDFRGNVSCGRLCIRTFDKSIISEVINVIVAGVSYIVRIRKVGIWSIDIQKQKEESDSNLSMDGSEEVDMQDDLDMYVNENKQVEPQKEETSSNCKETTQDIDDVSIIDNLC